MLKKILVLLYLVVVTVMAAATFAQRLYGVNLYDQWWFTTLWALLTAVGTAWFIVRKMRRPSVVLLHLSFVVILLGALLTHLFAQRGIIHLREGETTQAYLTSDNRVHHLPFILRLDTFQIIYHPGTTAAADYESHLTIIDKEQTYNEIVSMNHICSRAGIRLYQNSYDEDGHGSVLTMTCDPWGIAVTYTGYALLFISLIWILIDPRGGYRKLLRSPVLKRGALSLMLLMTIGSQAMAAPTTVPMLTAEKLGKLNILYNDRICPLQTYALDFTKKLHGKTHYENLTAEQVLAGYLFFADEWESVPLTKQTDDREWAIYYLQHGLSLKVFPCTQEETTHWYAPADPIDTLSVSAESKVLITSFFDVLYGAVSAGDYELANQYLDRLLDYQRQNGGASIPSSLRWKAERLYNAVPFATILFMVCLAMGFLSFLSFLFWPKKMAFRGQFAVMLLSFLALTLCLALRWIISGYIPMSNGYETMLFVAWLLQLFTLLLQHRFRILLTFGFLLSGFFLLVSHISQMDPQIGTLMPVLRSPLLTLHVSIIMIAFALLSLTFISGITALIFHFTGRRSQIESLAILSRVFLYPALTTLGFGIFIGAIWANISWGTYWSWDPKEVWALITFMVYAVVVHTQSLPVFQRPLAYHLYVTLAFLTLLMTYFGVNYFLGGLHSYA